jgi:hypothetical protein
VLTVESTRAGDHERAEVANHIYAQRRPLQISHEASSILDFICPGDVLVVVRSDHLGRNPGTFSIARTNWKKKEQASECWSLPSTRAARWAAWF